MVWKRFSSLLFFLIFLPHQGVAETYILTDTEGVLVKEYDQLVNGLRPGDSVVFSDGRKHKIGKLLGSGSKTLVYELQEKRDLVIRIPKRDIFIDYMMRFHEGADVLQRESIPHVKINGGQPYEYALVERISNPITLDQFLTEKPTTTERKSMRRKLIAFSRATARLDRIGDFGPDQIVYDKSRGRWVLLDWMTGHSEAELDPKHLKKTPTAFHNDLYAFDLFDEYVQLRIDGTQRYWKPKLPEFKWIADLSQEIDDAIYEERLQLIRSCVRGDMIKRLLK